MGKRLVDENDTLVRRIAAARWVANHWRLSMLAADPNTAMAHPLNCVLAALDGEQDPAELGVEEYAHGAFRSALERA
jgi:hypothetical protein